MSLNASIAMTAAGSILAGSSIIACGLLGAFQSVHVSLPLGSPWAAWLFLGGLAVIVAPGAVLAAVRRWRTKLPARRTLVAAAISAASGAGWDLYVPVRAHPVHGGPAAAPRGANGGGAAATTSRLPRVGRDGMSAAVQYRPGWVPLPPEVPSRATPEFRLLPPGVGTGRMVGASAAEQSVEAPTDKLPAVRSRGARDWLVAAGLGSGVAGPAAFYPPQTGPWPADAGSTTGH